MTFILWVNIIALLFSFFVAGVLLGALFSTFVREKLGKLLSLRQFTRSAKNPILKPDSHPWAAAAVMNPAAAIINGRTHLIYRAIGVDGVSRFGYASSSDGIVFNERLPYPIYTAPVSAPTGSQSRLYSPILYPSGGSWGGYEDPRMVIIDGRVYVTFNILENWDMHVAYISMPIADFLEKRFYKWEGPTVISGGKQNKHNLPWSSKERDKNWTLFPEKIGGKFAVLHTIINEDPNRVSIEYVDDLATLPNREFDTVDPQKVPDQRIAWHLHVRSAGPPPIKTPRGWLVLYHANDAEGYKYKIGAMLLDLADPTHVIARASQPVLEPDYPYENHGKPGIVYACGATVQDDTLFIYYGGADKVVCVATTPLTAFVDSLFTDSQPALTAIRPTEEA